MTINNLRHVLTVTDLSHDEVQHIFSRSAQIKNEGFSTSSIFQRGRDNAPIVALAFFEPSTRTKLSFDSAAQRIGCNTIGFDNPASTSSAKGEQLTDTLQVISQYADAIVIRRKDHDTVDAVMEASTVPVISAGVGAQEHPSQALLDVFTIRERRPLDSINHIVTYGDLISSRTMNSQLRLLARQGITYTFVTSPDMQISQEFESELLRAGVNVNKTHRIDDVLSELDVLHIIRPQRERWEGREHEAYAPISQAHFDRMKPDAIVLHALPRTGELDPITDSDSRCAIWDQVKNGVYVRAALLEWILNV